MTIHNEESSTAPIKKPKKYAWSTDGERFQGDFDSKEDCVEEARAMCDTDEEFFYVGECDPFIPKINSIGILDQLGCDAVDFAGEAGEGWLYYISKQKRELLDSKLETVLSEWLSETGNKPTFFGIKNMEKYAVERGLE